MISWVDNMSKMGLYMSNNLAAGGGKVEVEIMKEQKTLLQKIEENTRASSNDGSTYQ